MRLTALAPHMAFMCDDCSAKGYAAWIFLPVVCGFLNLGDCLQRRRSLAIACVVVECHQLSRRVTSPWPQSGRGPMPIIFLVHFCIHFFLAWCCGFLICAEHRADSSFLPRTASVPCAGAEDDAHRLPAFATLHSIAWVPFGTSASRIALPHGCPSWQQHGLPMIASRTFLSGILLSTTTHCLNPPLNWL